MTVNNYLFAYVLPELGVPCFPEFRIMLPRWPVTTPRPELIRFGWLSTVWSYGHITKVIPLIMSALK